MSEPKKKKLTDVFKRITSAPEDGAASTMSLSEEQEPVSRLRGDVNVCMPLQQKRSDSPVPSCVSMKSDLSMIIPIHFGGEEPLSAQPLQWERTDSPVPSCVSMKSDQSMIFPIPNFGREEPLTAHVKQKISDKEPKNMDSTIEEEEETEESFIADQSNISEMEMLQIYKSFLKKTFQCLFEGNSKQGNSTLMSKIYTELYTTEGGNGKVNDEHEVRQIEMVSKRLSMCGTPIKCNDIFKPSSGQCKAIRSVLTKGVAGIGKTVSVQKFILDWAEGKANQDFHIIFPLPFRELNLLKDKKLSLVELLQHFASALKEVRNFTHEGFRVLFIFDGLDECRIPLLFHSNPSCFDITEQTTVSVLLTNLIKGNLLPNALLWITSRPAAASQIPPECVDQVTEVRGFSNPQKEEYFRKRVSDENLADKTIAYLKSFRSLYIMCHIPVFCWISATVLERLLSETERGEIPRNLTQMYTHYLTIQTCIKKKYTDSKETDEEMIFKLGKLAFEQLERGNLIFYEGDLRECDIDMTEASVYSGVCTEIFREEAGLYQGKMFCFVHLTIQEHLAALYVYLCFRNRNKNVLVNKAAGMFKDVSLSNLHKTAVELALQSKSGHLDIFLRFLLGLSLESNQRLLSNLLLQTVIQTESIENTLQYIKQKIRRSPSTEKCINLFHCLNELNDQSLVEEIQSDLTPGDMDEIEVSPAQWSDLELDEFDLRKYSRCDECLDRLMPVVKASRSVQLCYCSLTEKSCSSLASALISGSRLRQLDLSDNNLLDSGVTFLSTALSNPVCKLEILELQNCKLKEKSCSSLASALSSGSSLRELNLSNNELLDSGVTLLSAALRNPLCKLEKLVLFDCKLTEKSCSSLASALSSGSNLRHLNLSNNELLDSGVTLLSAALRHPLCNLEALELQWCNLTEKSCSSLASVLSSGSSLRQLNLKVNKLLDSGVALLSTALRNPLCKLETLELLWCSLTEESCSPLASILSSGSSLRQLELGGNDLLDSGVTVLSDALRNPLCKLEKLELCGCNLTEKSCSSLASALSSGSSLRQLNLNGNKLLDSGVTLLSVALRNPLCKVERIELRGCNLTEKSCSSLASAPSSGSNLRELDLNSNTLLDSGVTLLSTALGHPLCKLEKLELFDCKLTEKSCSSLASALSSGSSLRQLDLSGNKILDSGVTLLSAILRNPLCNLEKLELCYCKLTEKSCSSLASALSSGSSLLYLDLRGNALQRSDVELLSALQRSQKCKLQHLQW